MQVDARKSFVISWKPLEFVTMHRVVTPPRSKRHRSCCSSYNTITSAVVRAIWFLKPIVSAVRIWRSLELYGLIWTCGSLLNLVLFERTDEPATRVWYTRPLVRASRLTAIRTVYTAQSDATATSSTSRFLNRIAGAVDGVIFCPAKYVTWFTFSVSKYTVTFCERRHKIYTQFATRHVQVYVDFCKSPWIPASNDRGAIKTGLPAKHTQKKTFRASLLA